MHALTLDDPRERLLGRCLRRQAEAIPDADYIRWDRERFSFGEVNRRANACARAFRELGIGRGDRVAFWLDSGPEWIWTTAGLNKLGAIWVPINLDYKGSWLREGLEDCGARCLVTDAERLVRVAACGAKPFERLVLRGRPGAGDAPAHWAPLEELAQAPADEIDDPTLFYGDDAAILWTSGTTGRSKGVRQSHNVWIRGALDGMINSGLREGEVLYNCLPMYQSAAWVASVYRALVAGVPLAMDPRFSASEFWERTRYYGATMVFTLGAMHMFLWNAPPRDDDRDNPVRSASMIPMPDDLVPRFCERFGLESITQGYGQSEVMGLLNRLPGRSYPPGALGDPAPDLEVALLGDDDRPVAAGETGEICVRPREPFSIFNGYFGAPEATLASLRNLWYHTGDLGRSDGAGNTWFVDRKADFIRYKGRNISSFAVEAAVGAHPAVLQCAAHGVTSAELASEAELKVCIVRKPGATASPEEIARFVNDNAPYFFVPRYIEFLPELPQTPTGRVQKFELRKRGVTAETWDAQAAGFRAER